MISNSFFRIVVYYYLISLLLVVTLLALSANSNNVVVIDDDDDSATASAAVILSNDSNDHHHRHSIKNNNDGNNKSANNERRLKRFQEMSREQRKLSDQWLKENPILHGHGGGGGGDAEEEEAVVHRCPCDDSRWCRPILTTTTTTIDHDDSNSNGHLYGFAASNSTGQSYNWTYINTIAWASNDELMCRAHSRGVRVVLAAPSFNLTKIAQELGYYYHQDNAPEGGLNEQSSSSSSSSNYLTTCVQSALHLITSRYRDGIVFDYEDPLPPPSHNNPESLAYAKLIQTTREVFHARSSTPLQVSVCVAWSPDGIDGRNYPHVELIRHSDYVYVMDYDTQSQIIHGPCIANANAPISGMIRGIQRYFDLGVEVTRMKSKLILGVPWYGYRYPCNFEEQEQHGQEYARFCPIQHVPFRGVNCSDAAGKEIPLYLIMKTVRNLNPNETMVNGTLRRDSYMDAPFFNTVDNEDGTIYQYWFDDATSLRNKFAWVKQMGLGGVGPFVFDDVDPAGGDGAWEDAVEMWSTFDSFFSGTVGRPSSLVVHSSMEQKQE